MALELRPNESFITASRDKDGNIRYTDIVSGRVATQEEYRQQVEAQKAEESKSFFDRAAEIAGNLFTGETTPYEQTGALDNAINGRGRGVDEAKSLFDANSALETDSERAARLREAANIIGFDGENESLLVQTGMDDNDLLKSALALAKKKQSEPDDWEQFAADHPATVKYLEQQKNMAISYDDIKPWGRVEDTANQVKTHLEMMELEEKIADLGRKYDSQNISYNELSADQRVELNDLLNRRKELQQGIDTWSIGNVLGSLLTMKEDLPMALAIGLQTGLVGAGVGALGGGVGAIPGAITGFGAGFKIGMGASMGYRMAGTQYAENMMRADANGQYMDAKSLRQGAQLAGAGMTILGSVGVGRLTNKLPFGQAFDKFLRTTSPSVLNNPEARQAAWKGYLSTLGVGLKEAAVQDVIFGGGGAALTYGANRYSEALSGLDYSNREDGTLVENIINGMQQFAPLALGTGVGFSVGGRMMGNALGKKGNTPPMPVADGLNKTMDAVNETKTAGRSKEATREAVNTIFGENASAQDVEINARGIMRLCQEADPENPNLAVEVAQKLGVDEKTLNEAVETGDTVKVSVTDFVTEMKDSDLRSEMLKEVKDIDGVTENERGEILTHQQQVFEQNMEFIKKAANAEYDHNDSAWVAAYEATQNAYPKLKPKNLEQLTNVTYAMFKQAEERGVLELNGFENAEQAIRAVDVRRVDAPREQANRLNQAEIRTDERAATDVANTTVQELFQEKGKNDNVLAAIFPNAKYEGDKIVSAEQGRAIIELYKNANPSSLAHEMLHHFVFLHENAYRTGKMEGQVLQDFQKLAEFAGHELGTEWSEAEHEKLASAWETYLSEGKAPSLELVGTFERFKGWLKRIYQTLVRHAIPINDDVRGVFDRMLASDKELEMAQKFYEAEPLFAGREMGAQELREYAALRLASHKEAQREMDKRVMAEVNPAMKEIRDNAAATLRERIAGEMMLEPNYAARALLTAPRETADFKAAKATAIKEKMEERLDLLVKQSALGVEKPGMIGENTKSVSSEFFGGFSKNYDWYKEMFNRLGGKIPASWYRFIKAYKAGEKTLKQMPKTMREEYEYIANEQLTHGHKESMLGDIPEDIEFVNLKEGTPAMDWIVANGGGIRLDRQSVYERYGKGALPERWLTDEGGYTLDDVADFVYGGKAGGDRLFEELTTKPTFAKELSNRVRAGMAQFKEQEYGSLRESATKAVHNAKSLEALGVEMEILASKQEEFKAKQQQKTADAIAEGREKSKQKEKIEAERQKGKEAVQKQKEKDAERLDAAKGKAQEKGRVEGAREQHKLDVAVSRGKLRAKAAREMAREQLTNTKVGEVLRWQKYAALGKKAGDEAVRLLAKGDYEGALEAKDRQIMCHALALEAGKMDTEIKSAMKYFANIDKRGNKMKGMPHEFNVQTDKIMAKYGLLSREPLQGLDGDIPLRKFLYGDKEDPDYKSVVDTYDTPFVADFIIDGDGKAYSDLTINELRDLKTSLKSLRKIGRDADKTLADGKKQSISQMVGQMVEKLGTHVQRYANESSMAESKKSPFSLNDLKKTETVLRLMDKGEENGIFVSSIYNPIKQGLDDYANRSRKVIDDVAKIMSDTGYTQREIAANKTKYYTFDFIDGKVSHERIMLLCMNYGNDGNKDRARYYLKTAAEKNKKTWSEQELAELDSRAMKMFEKLTEKDLKLVQAVWDYLNTYAEDIRRHETECAGIDPKMVEAVPFSVMTADGKMVNMRGGYFPIRYDPNKSVRAMDLETANDLFKKNSAVQASVSHAHTKSRSQHIDRPLLLEWATFTDHLRNVNYDLAMRKPVRDVARILRRPDLQEAMAHAFGNDTVRMLNDWLRDIASDQRDMLKTSEKVLRWGRTRMSVAYLGLRTKALFIDLPQNFVTAAWQNGVDSTVKGVAEFYLTGDYREKINFVNQRSAMMRDKFSFMDANLSDLRQDFMGDVGIVGKITGGRVILPSNDKIQKLAFCVDSFSDGAVNYPTWIRYHSEAMARGLSDAEASLEADAKVRRQSVDTSKAGMAAIQRGSETLKLITPFYSYFNAYFNRLYYDYGMFRIKWADGQRVDAGKLLVRSLVLGVGLPVTIEAIMQGVVLNNDREKDKKKREENLKKEMISASFSYLANTMPVVGQLATTAVNKALDKKYTRFELSPVESAFNTITDTAGAITKFSASNGDAEAERKLVEAMAKAAAVTMPYPNMLNTFALNIWDIFAKGGDITLADIVTRRRNQK